MANQTPAPPGGERRTTGTTIVGDSVLPTGDGATAFLPDAAHGEVVDAEGASPAGSGSGAPLASAVVWLFRPDREPAAVTPDELPALVQVDANFVWVDLPAYSAADLQALAGLLTLHRKAVRQSLSPWQRPRLTVFEGHFFTSATVPRLDPAAFRIQAGQLDLFVGPNYLVSAHKQPLPFADHLQARALASPELVRLDAAFMLYVVLDELFAYYELLNEHLQGEIERMEERALRDTSDRFLEDLTHFKRYVFALAQLAEQHRALVAAYLRPDFPWVSGAEVEDYFEDLDDRLRRLLDILAGNRETVNGAFEIYVSQTTHRTNALIRVLTMASTVLFSSAVIIAIFGASIQGLATNEPSSFVLMVVCIVAAALATVWAFRRRGWI